MVWNGSRCLLSYYLSESDFEYELLVIIQTLLSYELNAVTSDSTLEGNLRQVTHVGTVWSRENVNQDVKCVSIQLSGTSIGENVMYEQRIIAKQVKAFLDILILAILNGNSMHGYKIVANIHKEFGILLSPASIYPLLHSLENKKLIEAYSNKGKTIYNVTSKGKENFRKKFTDYKLSIQIMTNFIKNHGETP